MSDEIKTITLDSGPHTVINWDNKAVLDEIRLSKVASLTALGLSLINLLMVVIFILVILKGPHS